MVSTGTSYGYGGTSEAYAGPKLESYDLGKYIGIFYITNDKSLSIKLDQGSKTYSVTSEDINYPVHKGAEIDYGYAIISETKL